MTFVELLLTAVALSMDAFAVSTCKGLNMRKLCWKNAVIIGLFFGGFQAAMPLIGWLLGKQFEGLITAASTIGSCLRC
jgi:putative Mn2+ efflux pump MntP